MKLSLIENVIVLQHRHGLTTGDVAKQLGISRVYLYKIISGQLQSSDRVETAIKQWVKSHEGTEDKLLSREKLRLQLEYQRQMELLDD